MSDEITSKVLIVKSKVDAEGYADLFLSGDQLTAFVEAITFQLWHRIPSSHITAAVARGAEATMDKAWKEITGTVRDQLDMGALAKSVERDIREAADQWKRNHVEQMEWLKSEGEREREKIERRSAKFIDKLIDEVLAEKRDGLKRKISKAIDDALVDGTKRKALEAALQD